jgi:hypothetical protein
MRIFSQFARGLSMELSACSGKVSAPKTEGADTGQLQQRGASLTAPHPLLHSCSVCLEQFYRAEQQVISPEKHLAAERKDGVVGCCQGLG